MVVELLPFPIRDWRVMCHNSSSPLCSSFILLPTKPAFSSKEQLFVSIEPLSSVFSSSEANISFNRCLFYFLMNDGPSSRMTTILRKVRSKTVGWDHLELFDQLATRLSNLNTSCFSCLFDNQTLTDSFAWYPDWVPRCHWNVDI